MSAVARLLTSEHGKQVWTWCPGCDSMHPFTVESDGQLNSGTTWSWDGNLERPTFSPSLLCYGAVHLCEGEHPPAICADPDGCGQLNHRIGHEVAGVLTWRFRDGVPDDAGPDVYGHGTPHTRAPAWGDCHSFLKDGCWQFLGDSAHHLAGQTVDMVPLPASWKGKP